MAFYKFIFIYISGSFKIRAKIKKVATIRLEILLFLIKVFLISLFLLIREKLR